MAQPDIYLYRLDVLSHGYLRQISSHNEECPLDIIELVKIWNTNHQSPKLMFNVLLAEYDNIVFECFLDKNHWNILNISEYTLEYKTADPYSSKTQTPLKGECHIKNFYDNDICLGFGKFKSEFSIFDKSGEFKISAKDAHDNVLIKSHSIDQNVGCRFELYADVQFNKFDLENKGKL